MTKNALIILFLSMASMPATAQGERKVSFTDRLIWNNPEGPRGDIPYCQTGQQPARIWGSIFPPGDNGAGDVLCFKATGPAPDPVNDGCYTVVRAVFGDLYWVIVFEENPPAGFLGFVEYQVTWFPVELFADGFEDGTTSSWSSTVGRGF